MTRNDTQQLAYTAGPDKFVPADLLTLTDVPNPGPPLQLTPNRAQRTTGHIALALTAAFALMNVLFIVLAFVETAGIAWATIPMTIFGAITAGLAHKQLIGNYAHNRAIMAERAESYELYDHYKAKQPPPGTIITYTTQAHQTGITTNQMAQAIVEKAEQLTPITVETQNKLNPPPENTYRKHWQTVAAEQRDLARRKPTSIRDQFKTMRTAHESLAMLQNELTTRPLQGIVKTAPTVVYKPAPTPEQQRAESREKQEQLFDQTLSLYVDNRIHDLDRLARNTSPNDIAHHKILNDLYNSLLECHGHYVTARKAKDKNSADRMFDSIKGLGAAITTVKQKR